MVRDPLGDHLLLLLLLLFKTLQWTYLFIIYLPLLCKLRKRRLCTEEKDTYTFTVQSYNHLRSLFLKEINELLFTRSWGN